METETPSNKTEQNIPRHVAIIMDGNRRWARQRDLPYIEGHREAIERIKELVEYCGNIGVQYLTLWVWSTKNWKRSPDFIKDIIMLYREVLTSGGLFSEAINKGAEIHQLGVMDGFPADIQTKSLELLQTKPEIKKIDLNFAVGYEGRDEIVRTIRKIIGQGYKQADINADLVERYLDTAGQPNVDLVIRTGGEKRTSGYLIWQSADAEYYFTDTYMPEFGPAELEKAFEDYSRRERRLGGDSKKY